MGDVVGLEISDIFDKHHAGNIFNLVEEELVFEGEDEIAAAGGDCQTVQWLMFVWADDDGLLKVVFGVEAEELLSDNI